MKKLLLSAFVFCAVGQVMSQSMNEDFESYTVGDYMGTSSVNWSTWSGTTGGNEDVQVTAANAHNGANSIYFGSSAATGGPQDVVLPFGGAYNSGQFDFDSWFFVESGKGGYFNIQGSTTIGQLYSMNCFMVQDGELILDNGDGVLLTTTYPTGVWFNLKLDINLNTNEWELLLDNVSQGVFQNTENKVASMDLYPVNNSANGNNISGFFMDEVNYNYTPYVLPNENGAVIAISNTSGLAGQEFTPSVDVRNLGVQTITSFDLVIDYNGNQTTEMITGVSINSYDVYTVDYSQSIALVAGSNNITATISNVNGTATDDDPNDDSKILNLDPLVPALGKMVVSEEGTGTWCGWCPRGAVMLDKMTTQYNDYFTGIAVHNGDPMTVALYDDGLGFSSFPTAVTDRGPGLNPSQIESQFLERIVEAPAAFITNGAVYNAGSRKLYVSVTADFQMAMSGDFRLACAITEDSVTGTSSGYNQSNYYSGGASGEMGGYELLGNPVPAADMVYDHVARGILPDVDGQINSFPASVNSGEVHTVSFVFDIDSTWDMSKMHIVGLLIDDDGIINNAGRADLEEAYSNGYLSVDAKPVSFESKPIYPNPSNNISYIEFNSLENQNVTISIIDISGKVIIEESLGEMKGNYIMPINVSLLAKGIYIVNTKVGEEVKTERLVVD